MLDRTILSIQTLCRLRSRLVVERTNLINQLRAIPLERGEILPVGEFEPEPGCTRCSLDPASGCCPVSANSRPACATTGERWTPKSS